MNNSDATTEPFAVAKPEFRRRVMDAVDTVMASDDHTDGEKQKLSRVMIEHELERMRLQSINSMFQTVLQSGLGMEVYIAYLNARQDATTPEEVDAANRVIAEAIADRAAGRFKPDQKLIEELRAGPVRHERSVEL